MSMPTVKVYAGFGFSPNETVTAWTELTSRVGYPGGIRWSYGRSNEREQPDAGTGSIVFNNSDRELDPTNTASVFYPDVKPMVPIKVEATHNASTRSVLYAYAEAWPPEWEGDEHGWVTVPIVDGFKLLSMARTSIAYTQQLSGARIGALLDAAGWPAGKRALDTGLSQIQAYEASQRIILNAIRETAAAELGIFFVGPNGNAVFLDRFNELAITSSATFGETGTDLPYEDVKFSYDESDLWNDVAVTPYGLGVQRAVSEPSKTAFGHRQLDKYDVRVISENVASDLAHWLLSRYVNPRLRVTSLTLEGDLFDSGTTDVMERILTLGIGDMITVNAIPAGGGTPISTEVLIEHVSHRIEATSWRTTWKLSPAFGEDVWLLGITGSSELGITTKLGF